MWQNSINTVATSRRINKNKKFNNSLHILISSRTLQANFSAQSSVHIFNMLMYQYT